MIPCKNPYRRPLLLNRLSLDFRHRFLVTLFFAAKSNKNRKIKSAQAYIYAAQIIPLLCTHNIEID